MNKLPTKINGSKPLEWLNLFHSASYSVTTQQQKIIVSSYYNFFLWGDGLVKVMPYYFYKLKNDDCDDDDDDDDHDRDSDDADDVKLCWPEHFKLR